MRSTFKFYSHSTRPFSYHCKSFRIQSKNPETHATFLCDEESISPFCHNANPILYQASISFDPVSNITPIQKTVLALARIGVWIAVPLGSSSKLPLWQSLTKRVYRRFCRVLRHCHKPVHRSRFLVCAVLARRRVQSQ